VPQLDLFAAVAARDDDDALKRLAERLPAHVRLGTSSWTFTGWRDIVYRQHYESAKEFAQRSLVEYAAHPLFRTVGVDRSFYAPVPIDELQLYATQVPPDFRFVQKVWAEVSAPIAESRSTGELRDNPTFLDPERFFVHQLEPSRRGLGDNLGPFVLSISPSRARLSRETFERKLERFLDGVGQGLQIAVELREATLMTNRYFDLLRRFSAVHCLNLWTNMPSIARQATLPRTIDGPFAVCRLMLPQGRAYADMKARYEPFDAIVAPLEEMRRDVAALAVATGRAGVETYVLVNNKVEGCSPLTARALAERIAR
jgi:uncharacterized protein YecE (DUF72 family)